MSASTTEVPCGWCGGTGENLQGTAPCRVCEGDTFVLAMGRWHPGYRLDDLRAALGSCLSDPGLSEAVRSTARRALADDEQETWR